MKVVEGSSFEMSDGSWLKPVLELDETDFERLLVDYELTEYSDKISLIKKYELLSTYAKFLLVMNQIKARMSDGHWLQREGKPMLAEARDELSSVIESVKGNG